MLALQGNHRRHGRNCCRHRYHFSGIHGRIYSIFFHGRNQRYILHAVRSDHGCCSRYISHQCPDIKSGLVCAYHDASHWHDHGTEIKFLYPFSPCFRSIVQPAYPALQKWSKMVFPSQMGCRNGFGSQHGLTGGIDEDNQDRSGSWWRYGMYLHERHDSSRKQSFTDHQGDVWSRKQHQGYSTNHELLQREWLQYDGRTGSFRRYADYPFKTLGGTSGEKRRN